MYVTARTLAAEIGVSEKTILAHVRQMERDGIKVKSRIGRPTQINRTIFMRELFPGWEESENE